MNFKLIYTPEAREGIQNLPSSNLKNIAEKNLLKISRNPFLGKKLAGKLKGLYSARITRKYRILYQIFKDKQMIIVLDVSHRKISYR
jgi:addiction module RelE/StbE family toxin